jgi:hypothetical protein
MAAISIGDCVGEGFTLIRRHPISVLCWGLVQTALFVGGFALMAPLYGDLFARMASAKAGVPATPDIAGMMRMQGVGWLLNLINAFVGAVIYCAIFRAVLRPKENRFAYLRVSAAELFIFVLIIGAAIAFGIAFVVAMIPAAIVGGIAIAVHAAPLGILLAVVLGLAGLVAMIYVALRLSLVGPMTVHDRQLRLTEAWALTKGHVGSLFLMALCLFAILFGVEMVLGIVGLIAGAGALSAAPGGTAGLSEVIKQHPAELLQSLTPALVVGAIVAIPFFGGILAIGAAPWAKAYQELAGPDIAATFS